MKCNNCPHGCEITGKNHGICHSRREEGGKITEMNYGHITSVALDPIEKKPLKRFMPGTRILSIGSWGCNMYCPWCQNDSISRGPIDCGRLTPEEVVNIAVEEKKHGNIGIAYTYNEALIGPSFVLEVAKLARKQELKNVLVTNGMANPEVFNEVLLYMDAMNIDLKTIDSDRYRTIGGNLDVILENIKSAAKGCHVELTTLIVPGFNDDASEMRKEADIIAQIDDTIPLHISRFFPAGNMTDARPTPVEVMYSLADTASEKIKYVFLGNI